MAKRGADGRNDHRIACIDRLPWLVIHPGARASRPHLIPANCCHPRPLRLYCHPRPLPPGCKAHQTRLYGVLFSIVRPARILIPANSLPSARPLPLQSAPNPPLRGFSLCGRRPRRPRSRVVFVRAKLDARAPGDGRGGRPARILIYSCAGETPARLLPPARPLAGPSRASSNALVALWPFFVALRGYLFLSLGVLRGCPWWVLYVS